VSGDPLLITLPVADRARAHLLHREGVGLEAIGEPADDGLGATAAARRDRQPLDSLLLVSLY